jgi:hypothetical protein
MPNPDNSIFLKVIEWVWIPIVVMLAHIYMRLFNIESRSTILERQQLWQETQRIENKHSRDEQRREIISRMDSHNAAVMKRMDRLESVVIKSGNGNNP